MRRWDAIRGRPRPGIRFRTTAAAALVVAVALVVAAVSMVVLLRRSLTNNVRAAAFVRAEAVSDLVEAGALGRFKTASDEEYIEVIGPTGNVIASSSNVAGAGPIVRLEARESTTVESVPFDEDDFLVAALATSDGAYTVMVGRSLDDVSESTASVSGLLAAGLPLLLLIIAMITWVVVGRALRPVEAIRRGVDEISTSELHRRVPVPQSRDEIARLATTMNLMLARLDEGQARQRRFVSDASHELRSPVTTIRQHAEVALRHPAGVPSQELAETVLEEGLRLQRLVEDLLLLAHIDEGGTDPARQTVDLDDVVFEAVGRIRQVTHISVDATAVSGGRVTGNRKQLERMAGNLLENAVRYARSSVAVTLRSSDDIVLFAVDDDGIGIPEKDRERVFQRFVRLDEARARDSGGTGLGLAIVAEVVTGHGGEVRVTESDAGGACFEIRLPASR